MPETGSIFTDWQQVERERPLLIDEDFSWSEPPRRRRREHVGRRAAASVGTAVRVDPAPAAGVRREEAPVTGSAFDDVMARWAAEYGTPADAVEPAGAGGVFDLSDPGQRPAVAGERRTVVITGRGDDRYLPAPRRRPSSTLRIHERSGFSPDRAGLWAVLLGIALVCGALIH